MTHTAEPDECLERMLRTARRLLANGDVGDDQLRLQSTVGRPIPVVGAGGELHSWFVPVTVWDRLGGFFQFTAAGAFSRFSAFPRRSADFGECPFVDDWLDAGRIGARAETVRREGETAGVPFLTFDGTPERLVWAVRLSAAEGRERLVYVIGDVVYSPRADTSIG